MVLARTRLGWANLHYTHTHTHTHARTHAHTLIHLHTTRTVITWRINTSYSASTGSLCPSRSAGVFRISLSLFPSSFSTYPFSPSFLRPLFFQSIWLRSFLSSLVPWVRQRARILPRRAPSSLNGILLYEDGISYGGVQVSKTDDRHDVDEATVRNCRANWLLWGMKLNWFSNWILANSKRLGFAYASLGSKRLRFIISPRRLTENVRMKLDFCNVCQCNVN